MSKSKELTQTRELGIEERRALYNRLTREAALVSIILKSVKFDMKPDVLVVSKDEIDRTFDVSISDFTYDQEEMFCLTTVTWDVRLRHRRKTVAKCNASYVIVYKNIRDMPEDVVLVFVDSVGKAATYSYFRALFAHLDWASDMRSPPLPMVQFAPAV